MDAIHIRNSRDTLRSYVIIHYVFEVIQLGLILYLLVHINDELLYFVLFRSVLALACYHSLYYCCNDTTNPNTCTCDRFSCCNVMYSDVWAIIIYSYVFFGLLVLNIFTLSMGEPLLSSAGKVYIAWYSIQWFVALMEIVGLWLVYSCFKINRAETDTHYYEHGIDPLHTNEITDHGYDSSINV